MVFALGIVESLAIDAVVVAAVGMHVVDGAFWSTRVGNRDGSGKLQDRMVLEGRQDERLE